MEAAVKRNTKRIGDISELRVMLALMSAGYDVAIPFGDDHRYDLIVEKDNILSRVQVKTGRLRKGVVVFNSSSSHAHRCGPSHRLYIGEIEYFGVFCPDTEAVYLVPLAELAVSQGMLRVLPVNNGQVKKLRWARDYVIPSGRCETSVRSTLLGQLRAPS